ncbi:hypothetical protein JCM25156A_07010 [Komagataeibacter kakiaceti JCM 25156]
MGWVAPNRPVAFALADRHMSRQAVAHTRMVIFILPVWELAGADPGFRKTERYEVQAPICRMHLFL